MEIKKQFKYFTIFNHKKEEDYLRQMHRQGWEFLRVSGIGTYYFVKCQGKDVVYQLDYNPQTKESRSEYLQMFRDCGWEYLQDFAGYSYFKKPADQMNGEEGIFNDDDSRDAMMGRVYKGRLFPLIGIFCACLFPQFVLNLFLENYGVAALLGGILALYAALFLLFAISHYRMKKK